MGLEQYSVCEVVVFSVQFNLFSGPREFMVLKNLFLNSINVIFFIKSIDFEIID